MVKAPEPARPKGARERKSVRSESGLSQELKTWLAIGAGVVAVMLVVFANSLSNGWVFDDGDLILTSHRIKNLGAWQDLLTSSYRPLRTFSYAVDYAVWGLDPTGFRITNIAIHAINCVLALLVARKLLVDRFPVIVATLVFAIHPVQVESVAYVAGRRDVLFTLFYLAAFVAYTRFRETRTWRASLGWLGAAGVGFGLGLMSKEMAASLPIVCLLWDLYLASAPGEGEERPSVFEIVKRVLRRGAVLYGVAFTALVGFAYYTLVIRAATTRIEGSDVVYWGGSLTTNLLTVPLTYAHYVWLTIWPVTLAVQYYGAFEPATGFADPRVIPAALLLFALVGISLYLILKARHRVVGFGIAWFLATLLPASQILPHHEIVADHYLYLPMIGAGVVLAAGLRGLAALEGDRPWRKIAYATAAVLLLLLAVKTVSRNRDFESEATLWRATYEAVPESTRAAYNFGLSMTKVGDHNRAIDLYRESIQLDPTFVPPYYNLAATYGGLGRYDDAKRVFESALASDLEQASRTWHTTPQTLAATFRTELALLDAQTGQTEKARDALTEIVRAMPDLLRAQGALAQVLKARGELDTTIESYEQRVAADPSSVADHLILASLLMEKERADEALPHFERVLELNPDSTLAGMSVALALRKSSPDQTERIDELFTRARKMALTPFDQATVEQIRGGTPAAESPAA